ncbi:MAG TPA: fumarylacetoacetate hydrolase family protein [Polyangiaceae bacterium]|jgi:2-keto-4-pentenoate hydratase/2-oxohepta-3-ene-1,7-dioic acid hydratase in catechol pathway|nr:fumarylacetoacetate hydrolase family protein [Polyangiaceae bacterium]
MKLFRFGAVGAEKPGLIVDGVGRVDVSAFGEDYGESFFGSDGPARLGRFYAEHPEQCPHVAADARIGPAIARPSKIVCVGMNYRDHALETGSKTPDEPVLFMKATSAICGPYDDVSLPRGSVKTDWEVELGVVIGKTARYVTEQKALDHVAGFVLLNDYSEREFQRERGGQFTKGKSADTFAPIGPFVVTADVLDASDLRLWLNVNGEPCQDSRTSSLIFSVPRLIAYISSFMTLLPGDLLSTGTPAGVGLGRKPPSFLKVGDLVEYGIDGLGEARQTVSASA